MSKKRRQKNQNLPRFLILGGLLVAIAAIFLLKEKPQKVEVSGELPQVQLAKALEAGLPVLAFYHSNNCQSCIDMMHAVNQVFPEFQGEVVLVDVNVYDDQNQALLRDVGLRYIPTQMFYDRSGKQETVVGVMHLDALRDALVTISKGQ